MKKAIAVFALVSAFVAPARAETPFSWTGMYIGANAGYAWGSVDQFQTSGGMPVGPFSYDADGYSGALVAGVNFQINNAIVVGVEAEGGYMDAAGSGRIPSSTPGHYQALELDGGMYGMASARVGAVFGRFMLFGKAGFVHWAADAHQTTTKPGFVTHGISGFSGVAYGGGLEYAIDSRWSIKAEWVRMDFGARAGDQTSVTDPPIGFIYTNRTEVLVDTVKLGVNFRF